MTPKEYGKVAVLLGGLSAEREVSLKSGAAVLAALRRRGVDAHGVDVGRDIVQVLSAGRFDRAFIILHGRYGEDGVMQGALEMLGMPYTGSGVMGSAIGMDKLACKRLWTGAGVPTAEFETIKGAADLDRAAQRLGFPLIVKPAREGSSIGISKVKNADGLEAAWTAARKHDPHVLAERCIKGPELTAAVLGEQVLPLIRLETPRDFYDYEAKYLLDTTKYHCPAGIDPALEERIRGIARRAFDLLNCSGWGRVDFMIDADGSPYVLEINTVPGMTDHSLVPMAARHAGIEFDELVMRILATSEGRK